MINKVILLGWVGTEPEIKHTENNTFASFSLATSDKYKKDDKTIENTEWHSIKAYKKLAEIIEKYVKKGDLIYLEGKKKTSEWQDKEGNKRYSVDIDLGGFDAVLKIISSKKEEQSKTTEINEPPQHQDDLPF